MNEGIGKDADERLRAAFKETGMTMSQLNQLRFITCIAQALRDDQIEQLATRAGVDAGARRIAEEAIEKARRRS